ncbi:MAG: twin-arginine translocation signal domain-containing protein, partial [Acidobacteriota bacterium]|nr:twin-arginine translocation signal domain-containing protein [Acidobacteriota bacterium]
MKRRGRYTMAYMRLTRREFHRMTAMAGMSLIGGARRGPGAAGSPVALVKTGNRHYGIHRAVE